jgi:hypothetical protein
MEDTPRTSGEDIMRHPDLTSLRAFALDDGDRGSGTARHLERCTDCRATVVSMRSIVATVREDFTQSAPPQVLDGIIARRAAGDRVILADVEEIDTRRRDMSRVTLPWAVAILLGASVAAAAMPGSPLRQWIIETFTQRRRLPLRRPPRTRASLVYRSSRPTRCGSPSIRCCGRCGSCFA